MRNTNLRPVGALRPDDQPPTLGGCRDHAQLVRDPLPRVGGSALRSGGSWLDGSVSSAGRALGDCGRVSGGGECASGPRSTHGGAVGAAGSVRIAGGPDFSVTPPTGGYVWWVGASPRRDRAPGL